MYRHFTKLSVAGLSLLLGLAITAGNQAAAQRGEWETETPMPNVKSHGFHGVIDGKLHAGGGAGFAPGNPINEEHYEYDPATDSWTFRAPIPTTRGGSSAVIDRKIYVVGGCFNFDCRINGTNLLEVYNPDTNSWSTLAPMPTARATHATAALDGKLYAVGGWAACPPCVPQFDTIEVYDPVSNQWDTAPKAPMPTKRESASAIAINGKLYVVGGSVRNPNNPHVDYWVTGALEVYDPTTDSWATKAPMPTPRTTAAVRVIGGMLHVVGGDPIGGVLATHEVYDPQNDSWSTLPDMPTARVVAMADVIDNRLYVAGGVGITGGVLGAVDVMEVFSPTVNLPPTANAGPDQAIRAGDTVSLDGSASFDDNTPSATLDYAWSFFSLPVGSLAVLTGDDTSTPSFTADVAGTYVVQLVVTDEGGLSSDPDQVEISSDNLAPTAAAGDDELVIIGTNVVLDGWGSSDPELDPLTYEWAITAAPVGSIATLTFDATVSPELTPDLEGVYEVTLTVSDFIGPGAPDSVEITATTAEGFAETQIVSVDEIVDVLPPEDVTTAGNQNALQNFLSQAIAALLPPSDVAEAINKLEKAIARTDGCVLRGAPDGNGPGRDWITDCAAQTVAYNQLNDALNALLAL